MENHQAKLLFRRVWHSLMEWWHSVEGPSFATLKYQINVHFPQLFFWKINDDLFLFAAKKNIQSRKFHRRFSKKVGIVRTCTFIRYFRVYNNDRNNKQQYNCYGHKKEGNLELLKLYFIHLWWTVSCLCHNF